MNDSRPFHVFLHCAPCCVLAPPLFSCFHNDLHSPPVVGMARSLLFFIPSMFPALGLHLFYKKRSSTYKPKNESLGMDVPPNTMESDSATTLVQDSTAIFAEDGLRRTPQRRSN